MSNIQNKPLIRLDASTWQHQLEMLTETMAQKVLREGARCIVAPPYLFNDLFMMLRYALTTYRFLHYLLADERRKSDSFWKNEYAIVAFTNIRSLIDCLYNVTYILEDPAERAKVYRLSGLTKLVENHKEERLRYGKDPEWDDHLSKSGARLRHTVRISGFDPDAMPTEKAKWPTMGKYLTQSHGKDNPHSKFLRIFAYGQWREYSNLSHASLEGLLVNGVHFVKDSLPHEIRPNIDAAFPQTMTMHVARAAALLICIVTELQAYCRFDGARINERIREVWSALMPVYEVRELYDGRYKALMVEKAIWLPNQT